MEVTSKRSIYIEFIALNNCVCRMRRSLGKKHPIPAMIYLFRVLLHITAILLLNCYITECKLRAKLLPRSRGWCFI